MTTELATRPALAPVTDDVDDDKAHLCCDHTDDWALCGTDISAYPWNDDESPAGEKCPTCQEFDRADFCAHCAMGDET